MDEEEEKKDGLAKKGIMIVKRDQVPWQMGVESEMAQRPGLQ